MRLDELVFVTSNEGKRREAEAVLGVRLRHHDLDIVEPQSLDLREEAISDVNGLTGNLLIARGTVIENAALGAGDERDARLARIPGLSWRRADGTARHNPQGALLPPADLKEVRQEAETKAIRLALIQTYGNISRSAELLGITRPTLYDLLDKYGLSADGFARKKSG